MKYQSLLITLLFSINTLFAVIPPGDESPAQLLQAPVLMGGSQPADILPNTTPFCFDKQLAVKMQTIGHVAEQCLYIDTHNGVIGHVKAQLTALSTESLCEINPEASDFNFLVYGMKGSTFFYYNQKPSTTIKHFVMSAKEYYFQGIPAAPAGGQAILHLKTMTRTYCNNRITGKAYQLDGDNRTWFLFGRQFPPSLKWEDYFGNLGVGYLKTDHGLYLIMELEFDGNSFKITSAEDVHTCFDPQMFHIMEDLFYTKKMADFAIEREKLVKEEAKLTTGDCIPERTELHNFKMRDLAQRELDLNHTQVGNIWEEVSVSDQSYQAQQAMIGLMDAEQKLRQDILENKLSLCRTRISLNITPTSASLQSKLTCLVNFMGFQESYLARMETADFNLGVFPGKLMAEKSKLYLQLQEYICKY